MGGPQKGIERERVRERERKKKTKHPIPSVFPFEIATYCKSVNSFFDSSHFFFIHFQL